MSERERLSTGGSRSASSTGTPRGSRMLDASRRYEKTGAWLMSAPQEVAWWTGGVYQGHTMKKKGDQWLLVMKITKKGKPLVSFSSGASIVQVIERYADALTKGIVDWRPDKFAQT